MAFCEWHAQHVSLAAAVVRCQSKTSFLVPAADRCQTTGARLRAVTISLYNR